MFGEFILFVRGHTATEVNPASNRPKGVYGAKVFKLIGTAIVGQRFETIRRFGGLIRLKGLEEIKHFESRDIKSMTIFSELTTSSALDTDSAGGSEISVQVLVDIPYGIKTCLVIFICTDPV